MHRSDDRVLTTHVSSLIRPAALVELLHKRQNGEHVDEANPRHEHEWRVWETVGQVGGARRRRAHRDTRALGSRLIRLLTP